MAEVYAKVEYSQKSVDKHIKAGHSDVPKHHAEKKGLYSGRGCQKRFQCTLYLFLADTVGKRTKAYADVAEKSKAYQNV